MDTSRNMDQERFQKHLIEFIKEAIDMSDGSASGASDYLNSKKKPGFLARDEKKKAFYRVQKVFSETRDRPMWFVLQCFGLKAEDLE